MQSSSPRKSDESIYKIVHAAIQRKSANLNTWQFTKFWEDEVIEVRQAFTSKCPLVDCELPILCVYLDPELWVVFSTRYIHYSNSECQNKIATEEVSGWEFGDFKGYKTGLERMMIHTKSGTAHWFLYETGYASMAPIYALRTLVQITQAR